MRKLGGLLHCGSIVDLQHVVSHNGAVICGVCGRAPYAANNLKSLSFDWGTEKEKGMKKRLQAISGYTIQGLENIAGAATKIEWVTCRAKVEAKEANDH